MKSVRIRVRGDYAVFSRPEAKVERFSYEVPTPSAARGILDAILWKPQMRWVVQCIEVLKPVRFANLKRNELQKKVSPVAIKKWIKDPQTFQPQVAGAGVKTDATPRATQALRDVDYVIEARPLVYHPNRTDTPEKYIAMFTRRVEKGQCFHQPALGCREFPADVTLAEGSEMPIAESRELGVMLYDIIFTPGGKRNEAVFFEAKLENGVVECRPEMVLKPEICQGVLQCSSKR